MLNLINIIIIIMEEEEGKQGQILMMKGSYMNRLGWGLQGLKLGEILKLH